MPSNTKIATKKKTSFDLETVNKITFTHKQVFKAIF